MNRFNVCCAAAIGIFGSCILVVPAYGTAHHSSDVNDTVRIDVAEGWNMISLPLIPLNRARAAVFPNAMSNAYRFDGHYVATESLDVGVGYWLKFPSSDSILLVGKIPHEDTLAIRKGWNMIGSLGSRTLSTSKFAGQFPDSQIASTFYGYDSRTGYSSVSTVVPGKGYWVKSPLAGDMVVYEIPLFIPSYTAEDTTEAEEFALWLSAELTPSDSFVAALLYNLNFLRWTYDDSIRFRDSLSVVRDERFTPPWVISEVLVKFDSATAEQVCIDLGDR